MYNRNEIDDSISTSAKLEQICTKYIFKFTRLQINDSETIQPLFQLADII